MGIGLIPDRAFEVLSEGMNLQAVPLLDDWADRELRIVVRDAGQLSVTGRLMFDHLTGCRGEPQIAARARRLGAKHTVPPPSLIVSCPTQPSGRSCPRPVVPQS